MMVAPFVKCLFYRGILPLSLLFAAFIRPCFISVIYVCFALLSPVLPTIHPALPLPVSIRLHSVACAFYCLLTTTGMIIYQIFEAVTVPSEEEYIARCNDTSVKWLRYAGFVRFHPMAGLRSALTILPEIIAFVASLTSFVVVVVFSHRSQEVDVVGTVRPVRMDNNGPTNENVWIGARSFTIALKRFSNFAIIVLAAVAGCVQPSILNFVYFLVFLFVASWWALYNPLRHGIYNRIKKILLFFAAFHILAIYVYQIPIIQEILPGKSILARIVGLSPILLTTCEIWWMFWFNDSLQMPALINPLFLLVFYHVLMLQLIWTYHGSRNYVDENDAGSSIHEELLPPDGDDAHLGEAGQVIPLKKMTSQIADRHRIGQIFGNAENPTANAASKGMVAIFSFVLYHAYTFSLLAMMTWALLYHSIFGLLLLVLTCALWMFKDSRGASFAMAPTITIYVEFLLLVQYVCSMNVTSSELQIPDWLKMVGFVIASNMWSAFVTLSVKLLLSLPVFLLLRLSVRESFYDALSEHERVRRIQNYGTFNDRDPALPFGRRQGRRDRAAGFVHWLSLQFTKCSIFFVALVLLIVACQPNPVLYTIGFFCIWCLLVIYFKISFGFFCRIAYPFWLGLIIYTSVIIISLYVYQFPKFPEVWTKWTGLDKKWNDDIGLINYSNIGESGALFARLFTPISLFVVTMLQLKFFHDPWITMMRRTSQDRGELVRVREGSLSARTSEFINRAVELIWRITEIHITKIVFIVVTIFAANNICALYIPLVIAVTLALLLPSLLTDVISLLMCVYLCAIAAVKMIYQLSHFPDLSFVNRGESCNATGTLPEWIGIEKESNTWQLLGGMVITIIALALQSVVIYRQRHSRRMQGLPEYSSNRVFPSLIKDDFDRDLNHAMQFLVDFGFFKFGLELSMIMMAINAWVRMDMLGAVMCIWIGLFALNKRCVSRKLWYIFVIYLGILFPLQYILYVGLPKDTCLAYPWDHVFGEPSSSTKNVNFDIWMGLSNYSVSWPAGNLIADFFVLLLASCQLSVFRCEGTENDSIFDNDDYDLKPKQSSL
ncbi:hypothetical protein KIN20_035076 [Parelaphostrongylus tenuis]|uniref:Piezo TM1-24 domain-containing protein n=1 Tax=Parelaphostrongylus tenuis TaxID=148309 RepID=A0AAD5RB83_PARTN|nr:hypothetical protein KIN20_035076 [Parelaphostrongylus tenuis]